ncbi:MAG: hypothetical protein ACP5K2_06195 [bacterium]
MKERILSIVSDTLWLLLGAFLNILYPNIFSFSGLLPNFLLIFSILLAFTKNFASIGPLIIVISVIDSIWRGINPGINALSLIVSIGLIYFIFHRLWSSKWIIIISIFLVTVIYFLVSFPLIYINKIGILSLRDALDLGLVQGVYNTIIGIIILLFLKRHKFR